MLQVYEVAYLIKLKDLETIKNIFLKTIKERFENEFTIKKILEALEFSQNLHQNQLRESGIPYITHPLIVAIFLAKLNLDEKTIIAGLLHDVLEDTNVEKEDIINKFDREVFSLIDGVTKIHDLHNKTRSIKEANTISKMFFAMTHDIRIILIKLSDKLHNMTTLKYLPKNRRERIARDCLSTYVPIAERLGISALKTYLEDLSFKYIYPKEYKEIKNFLSTTKIEREKELFKTKRILLEELKANNIDASVSVRSKHFYSIFQKIKVRSKKLTQIFDIAGIRIICKKKRDCYGILEIVHRKWKPIINRLKDYIANPKENGYQSIHTTIKISESQFVEIQIRTEEMDKVANFGIAAHLIYKEDAVKLNTDSISFINRIKKWQTEYMAKNIYSMEDIQKEILSSYIYVYTPNAEIIELPLGSNAIDFAYAIHTDIGERAFYAKVNGVIRSLTKPLKNEQVVEIVTSPLSKPNIVWLNSVKTKKARSRIRTWLNKNDNSVIIENNLIAYIEKEKNESNSYIDKLLSIFFKNRKNLIEKIKIASCCSPTIGENIVGFINKNEIIVHRENCEKIKNLNRKKEVEVEWEIIPNRNIFHIILIVKNLDGVSGYLENIISVNDAKILSLKKEDNGNDYGIINLIITSTTKNFRKIFNILRKNTNMIHLVEFERENLD